MAFRDKRRRFADGAMTGATAAATAPESTGGVEFYLDRVRAAMNDIRGAATKRIADRASLMADKRARLMKLVSKKMESRGSGLGRIAIVHHWF